MKLNIKNLKFKYRDEKREILNDISFSVNQGEWVSIIGKNGSGKSTLVKLISGILNPVSGEISYDDLILNDENSYEIRKHVGVVFQNPDNQFVETNVADDIAFGLENQCVRREEMDYIIDESLDKVNMLDFKFSDPSTLSGGQKQRVAIASILSINPDILIFDEATSFLDPKGRKDFINIVRELKKTNKTIIMITHNMDEVLLSDRTIVLNDGKVAKDSKTIDVLNDYELLKKSNLEMPNELYMYHELKRKNIDSKGVLDLLWELASKK